MPLTQQLADNRAVWQVTVLGFPVVLSVFVFKYLMLNSIYWHKSNWLAYPYCVQTIPQWWHSSVPTVSIQHLFWWHVLWHNSLIVPIAMKTGPNMYCRQAGSSVKLVALQYFVLQKEQIYKRPVVKIVVSPYWVPVSKLLRNMYFTTYGTHICCTFQTFSLPAPYGSHKEKSIVFLATWYLLICILFVNILNKTLSANSFRFV